MYIYHKVSTKYIYIIGVCICCKLAWGVWVCRFVHWCLSLLQHSKYPPFHPRGTSKMTSGARCWNGRVSALLSFPKPCLTKATNHWPTVTIDEGNKWPRCIDYPIFICFCARWEKLARSFQSSSSAFCQFFANSIFLPLIPVGMFRNRERRRIEGLGPFWHSVQLAGVCYLG